MKRRSNILILAIACLVMLPAALFAQLPTPTYGWNMGNTLEPPCGEGCWGGPASQSLIEAVADAGFNAVRIPCAWESNANQQGQIDPTYMARVREVVDWCYARNLYVMINSHWDGGWLDNSGFTTFDPAVNAKVQSYWTQIANTFVGYDSHLLFSCTNEPDVNSQEKTNVLLQYYQTFVNTVRATGGQNTNRWLVLSGPSTNIDYTNSWMNSLPSDPTPGRLAVEVHDYSPFQYTLMTSDADWGKMFYFWGLDYRHPTRLDRNPTWGEEDYIIGQYQLMKTKFVDQGIPVILGEFHATKRSGYPDLTGWDYDLHLASRTYYHKTLQDAANAYGLKPFYWDTPGGFFNWTTGALVDPDNVLALTGGPALPPPSTCTPSTTSVSSIAVTTVSAGKGKKSGQATVTVVSDCGLPVSGATVTGDFSGTLAQSGVSAQTNASGIAVLQTSTSASGKVNVTFCVTTIAMSGLVYNPSANVESCDHN